MGQAAKRLAAKQQRGSGGQGRAPEPRYLTVGQVVGAHGLSGELKVKVLTDDPHRFGLLERVFIGLEEQDPQPRALIRYRLSRGQVLLKLHGCDDRTTAQTLRGYLVEIPLEEAIPLEEGEYYEHQILDLEVWTVSGECLGTVVDILYTGANEVYVVEGAEPPAREILIPAIEDVVREVDLELGRMVVELLDGLV